MIRLFFIIIILTSIFSYSLQAKLLPELNIIKKKAPFPGYLYKPNDDKNHNAIIILHGSEGGNGDFWYEGTPPTNVGEAAFVPYLARFYASLGFVTYAVCYFDCEHHQGYSSYPPNELKEIDLFEITYKALKWLKNSEFVNGKKVFLFGASRGAEQAVLLASLLAKYKKTMPEIVLPDGVIALSPIENVGLDFPKEEADRIINGLPPGPISKDVPWKFMGNDLKPFDPIEVEQYMGPLLVNFFTPDPVWGNWNSPIILYNRYFEAGVNPKKITINKEQSVDELLEQLSTPINNKLFLHFNFEGHCFPPRNTEANSFLLHTLEKFLKQNR